MKKYSCFDVIFDNQLAHIILNRPEKRNSMTTDFWKEFPEIVSDINQEGIIRVIIISSTGPHFCSGLDLSIFQSDLLDINKEKANKAILLNNYIEILQNALNILQECRIPVISAIQGACIGGGLDLVCASDIRLGTKDSYFSILETKLGLVADIGTFPRLVKLIPDGLVRELAFTGRNFNSNEAKLSGFLNNVYPDQKSMITAAFELGKEISNNSPAVVFGCKEAIKFSRDHTTAEGLDWIKMWNSAMFNMKEVEESFKAKIEKRTSNFDNLPKKITKIN
jgi:enoyl-CoA hydratase